MSENVAAPHAEQLSEIIATHRALFGGFTMMADEVPAGEATTEQQPAEQSADVVDWKAKYEETLKHSRTHEDRAKQLAGAAKELEELKASQMSDAEKAAKRLEDAERAASEATARADRRDVALKHGLSADDAAMLDSLTDPDAMERLAARLAKSTTEARKRGSIDPAAGKTPAGSGNTAEREFVHKLFGSPTT